MMLYPTVQELTNEKVNRYKLVIATAKCARHIVEKEAASEGDDKRRYELERRSEISDQECEKPVSVAVRKIHDGEYKILD
ncbi:MAG: DNA-directed RNA polymerase subunit omega [Clostridia bacterium]|nr:DNA-directed RNA polymerase subunit omega [Clostridia bacterium]